MRANFRIKCEKSDAIALMMGEVRQARRQDPRIIDLLDLGGAVIHGSANVQQYQDASVRFALVQLDIKRSDRANTFQSMRLISSPGMYCLYDAKSTLKPV